jgi:hypothetical protein
MVRESGVASATRRLRPLSLRRRFVMRGKYLQQHPPFRHALEQYRDKWDRSHPRFPAHKVWDVPLPPCNPGLVLPLPSSLQHEWERYHQERHGFEAECQARGDINSYYVPSFWTQKALWAMDDWQTTVVEICQQWWPPEYYPNWLEPPRHPAGAFVAACLIMEPAHVPTDWIAQDGFVPRRITSRGKALSVFGPTLWRSRHQVFLAGLREAIRNGSQISENLIAELESTAEQSAAVAALDALSEAAPNHGEDDLYIPLVPGLSTYDLAGLEPILVELGDEADRRLHEQARELRNAGHSVRSIAGTLGVDRHTVLRWLGTA